MLKSSAPLSPILNFAWACDQILQYEGSAYTNDPDDPGGPTKWGITLADYRLHKDPKGTADDVKALSKDTAIAIYKNHYWDPISGDSLPFYMAFLIFDFGVNSGISHGVKYAQAVMKLAQDGAVGPAFLAAAPQANPLPFISDYHDAKMNFYSHLGTFWKYGSGWTRRATTSKELATAIVTDYGAAHASLVATLPNGVVFTPGEIVMAKAVS